MIANPLSGASALWGKTKHVWWGFIDAWFKFIFVMIYFFSGLAKCLGHGWWNGSNLWRTLTIPPFDLMPPNVIAPLGFLLPGLGLAVCLLETTYPFLIWPRATRKLVLCAICTMHLGIGLLMGMYLFAGIMLVLNLAAFWPEEWTNLPALHPSTTASRGFHLTDRRKRLPPNEFRAQ